MIESSGELIKKLNELKKYTFFEILELSGRVFIIVDYDENVVIGERGFFCKRKKKEGLCLFSIIK